MLSLDPLLAAGHQALNTERAIPAAEWWGLLALEQEQGRDAVLSWQRRAAGAGRREVRLAYYEACAANAAFASAGGRRARSGRAKPDTTPVALPPEDRAPGNSSAIGRPAPAATAQALDRNRALLLGGIERLIGRTARHPDLLAAVPLSRLARWRKVAGHPGLRVWNDPLGYLIAEAVAGNDPPSDEELDAWAQRAGIHWLDPRLSAWRDEGQEWEAWDEIGNSEASPASYLLHADDLPDAPDDPGAALHQALIEMLPSRSRAAVEHLAIQVTDDETWISCADQATYEAARDIQAVIRDALLDLGLPGALRIIAPARSSPPAGSHSRPGWIDAAAWLALDGELRAALAGSALAPDGGLDVRAEVYEVIRARFAAPVWDLFTAARTRASP